MVLRLIAMFLVVYPFPVFMHSCVMSLRLCEILQVGPDRQPVVSCMSSNSSVFLLLVAWVCFFSNKGVTGAVWLGLTHLIIQFLPM